MNNNHHVKTVAEKIMAECDKEARYPNLIVGGVEHWPILALSTVPLLTVLLYVLHDVHHRTSYNASRGSLDYDDDSDFRQDYVGVSLTALLCLFLLAFLVLSTMLAYYARFMVKRLELLEEYTKTGYIVNGNHHPNARLGWWRFLDYIQCRFVGRYDNLVYAHPNPDLAGLVGLPATAHGSTARGNQEGWVVKKLIRRSRAVMDRQRQMYGEEETTGAASRPNANEAIPIVLLPGCPRSAMLQGDVEYDAAYISHFRRSKRYKEVFLVLSFWMTFTLISAIYLVLKMKGVNTARDSTPRGIVALCVTVAITPVVAYGYNWLRWVRHKQFVTDSGEAKQGRVMNELPLATDSEEEIEMGQECCSGYYSQMT